MKSTRPAQPKPPKIYVFAVGIDKYRSTSIRELKFAKADAAAIGAALRETAGRLYEGAEVTLLLDEEVTAENIDDSFNKLAEKVSPDDAFVFFLAGHGINLDGRFYYLPQDYV